MTAARSLVAWSRWRSASTTRASATPLVDAGLGLCAAGKRVGALEARRVELGPVVLFGRVLGGDTFRTRVGASLQTTDFVSEAPVVGE